MPAGVAFDFFLSFKVFENDPDSYINVLFQAMRLLELDALGGAGSRGCGQIKFSQIHIDDTVQKEDFLESVNFN